jgi:hypothetical protein
MILNIHNSHCNIKGFFFQDTCLLSKSKTEVLGIIGHIHKLNIKSNVWRIHLGYKTSFWALKETYVVLVFDSNTKVLTKIDRY